MNICKIITTFTFCALSGLAAAQPAPIVPATATPAQRTEVRHDNRVVARDSHTLRNDKMAEHQAVRAHNLRRVKAERKQVRRDQRHLHHARLERRHDVRTIHKS